MQAQLCIIIRKLPLPRHLHTGSSNVKNEIPSTNYVWEGGAKYTCLLAALGKRSSSSKQRVAQRVNRLAHMAHHRPGIKTAGLRHNVLAYPCLQIDDNLLPTRTWYVLSPSLGNTHISEPIVLQLLLFILYLIVVMETQCFL
jgi:hypothetical protein